YYCAADESGCVCRITLIAYDNAVDSAQARLEAYHHGYRYDFCPNTSDILDPEVVSGQALIPQDNGYLPPEYPVTPVKAGVPDRAPWFPLDLTDVAGAWLPRRPDWADYLLGIDDAGKATLAADPNGADKQEVIDVLSSGALRLDANFRKF